MSLAPLGFLKVIPRMKLWFPYFEYTCLQYFTEKWELVLFCMKQVCWLVSLRLFSSFVTLWIQHRITVSSYLSNPNLFSEGPLKSSSWNVGAVVQWMGKEQWLWFILTFMWFILTFDVSYNVLIDKLTGHGWDKWAVRWTGKWVNPWAPGILVSSRKCNWGLLIRAVLQGLIVKPELFNISIGDWGDGADWTLSRFAGVEGGADPHMALPPFRGTALLLERQRNGNLMEFSRGKCQVLTGVKDRLALLSGAQ